MNTLKLLAVSFLITITFAACSKEQQQTATDTTAVAAPAPPPATSVKSGQGRAKAVALDSLAKKVTLDHNTVPGIMDAMTMEYPVSDAALLRGVKVGDSVTFTLQDHGSGNYVVSTISAINQKQ